MEHPDALPAKAGRSIDGLHRTITSWTDVTGSGCAAKCSPQSSILLQVRLESKAIGEVERGDLGNEGSGLPFKVGGRERWGIGIFRGIE